MKQAERRVEEAVEIDDADFLGEDNRAADLFDVIAGFARSLVDGDAAAAADHWDTPALVAGDDGVIALTSRRELVDFFLAASARYQAQGIVGTHAEIERIDVLTDALMLAMTRWPYLDAYGQEEGCEYAQYLLRKGRDGKLRITAAIMVGTCEPH